MFKTSQPSPERSNNVSDAAKRRTNRSKFKSLEEFSAWLDAQLLKLELSQQDFVTSKSVRRFFNER
jgi:hypothetical protein